jgi:hypothetical protein
MDPKHARYSQAHLPGDEFWGVGIENETYIQAEKHWYQTTIYDILHNQTRERYSVNYWSQYKSGEFNDCVKAWAARLPQGLKTQIRLPILVNAHTLSKCDLAGQHSTTYEKNPKPNEKFLGKTVLEDLSGANPAVFGSEANTKWWIFDGDTVEFMTQDYYCAQIEDVVEELCWHKERWMEALRSTLPAVEGLSWKYLKYPLTWTRKNYGFASFVTNLNNVGIFNNGTYHINLTMPTVLDKDGEIADWAKFERMHQKAARLFQWISPFLVAKFGSGDPLANLEAGGRERRFPAGSQRLAASRYVSLGTYDTEKMERGKILTRDVKTVRCDWRRTMYGRSDCAYSPLDVIGFDINFNKFKNHGLELRIFDWFGEAELDGLMRLLVWMLDASQELEELESPQKNAAWNAVAERCVWNGGSALLSEQELFVFRQATGISFLVGDATGTLDALAAYNRIWDFLCQKFNGTSNLSLCSRKMIRTPLFVPQHVWPFMSFMPTESVPQTRENYRDIVRVTLKRHITVPVVPYKSFRSISASRRGQLIQSSAGMEIHPHQIQCLPLYRSVTPQRVPQGRRQAVKDQEGDGWLSRLKKKMHF